MRRFEADSPRMMALPVLHEGAMDHGKIAQQCPCVGTSIAVDEQSRDAIGHPKNEAAAQEMGAILIHGIRHRQR